MIKNLQNETNANLMKINVYKTLIVLVLCSTVYSVLTDCTAVLTGCTLYYIVYTRK